MKTTDYVDLVDRTPPPSGFYSKLDGTPSDAFGGEKEKFEQEKPGTFCRWKFAFRDTSKLHTNTATMIRTRTGKWRVSTPLEEMNRSWLQHADTLEIEMHKNLLAKYEDPDGDEARANAFAGEKRARVAAMKAALAAKKK